MSTEHDGSRPRKNGWVLHTAGEPATSPPGVRRRSDDAVAIDVAAKMTALASPARVQLIITLMSGDDVSGRQVARAVGLPETTVSQHLRHLRRAGFIESERRGVCVYHRLRPEMVGYLCVVLSPPGATGPARLADPPGSESAPKQASRSSTHGNLRSVTTLRRSPDHPSGWTSD